MAEYDDDEVARLRSWWASNGTAAVMGILLGVVVLAGWYGWNWYSNRQDAKAADMYVQIQQGVGAGNITPGLVNSVKSLEDSYSGTPYANAAAMTLAAYYVRNDKLDSAYPHLEWAMNHASEKGMRQIARIRAARVRWAQDKPDAALKLLAAKHPPAFDSLYEELAGDIHAAQGDRTAAHSAYAKALKSLPDNAPRQALQQKMAANAPADAKSAGNAPAATQTDQASDS